MFFWGWVISVSNGQPASASVFNNAFLSRLVDSNTVGKIDLNNTDPLSLAAITNLQLNINNLIQNPKIFAILADGGKFTWSAPSLSFADDLKIYLKDVGFVNTVLASNSPISIADGESVYVTLDRTQTTNLSPLVNATLPSTKDTFRIATRIGDYLVLWDGTVGKSPSTISVGGSGTGSTVKVDLYDAITAVLPTGTSHTVDGVSVANGDTVLFPLISNRIYVVSGVGVSLVWTESAIYPEGLDPTNGDSVRVLQGDAFAGQLAVFNGTTFKVNDIIRLFNGADYWELNSVSSATLTDNTTDGEVFSVAYAGSENLFVIYSIERDGEKETGFIPMGTNGTTSFAPRYSGNTASLGVTFSSDVSGADVRLLYTTSSTGFDASIKFFLARWSDSAGGPGGVPSYSASTTIPAFGSNYQIQYALAGNLSSTSALTYNPVTGGILRILSGNTLDETALFQTTLSDNVSSQTTIFSFAYASYKYLELSASISRGTNEYMPTIKIVTNGTTASISYDGPTVGSVGITFFAVVNGSNVDVKYTSTNTGNNATFKYSIRRWI